MLKEIWKKVDLELGFEPEKPFVVEISNWGRLRTFNQTNDGTILKCGTVDGYPIYRASLFRPRDANAQKRFDYLQKQVLKIRAELYNQKRRKTPKKDIKETQELLKSVKAKLAAEVIKDKKKRVGRFQQLVHRIVVKYFLPPPTKKQIYVAHLDYDKSNNRVDNLKWMTLEENTAHNINNPKNIQRKERIYEGGSAKLDVTKVMYIKKLLNEGKTLRSIAKNFKVSDMQIHRIKTGENWGKVEAAK